MRINLQARHIELGLCKHLHLSIASIRCACINAAVCAAGHHARRAPRLGPSIACRDLPGEHE